MTKIKMSDTEDEIPEKFDFSAPESVIVEFLDQQIESWSVIPRTDEVSGAASYDAFYGTGLDYTILDLVGPQPDGHYVIEDIVGEYFRGDGWTTDDDMKFECGKIRPATEDEINLI